jgi:hypothetical protein
MSLILVCSFALPLMAKKKPKIPNPEVCSLKAVYVEGNNRVANVIRRSLKSDVGLEVTNSLDVADAILFVDVQRTPVKSTDRNFGPDSVMDVNLQLKDKAQKILYSGSTTKDSRSAWNFVNTDEISAAIGAMRRMNRVCNCK